MSWLWFGVAYFLGASSVLFLVAILNASGKREDDTNTREALFRGTLPPEPKQFGRRKPRRAF
jgi:hypothetical protein